MVYSTLLAKRDSLRDSSSSAKIAYSILSAKRKRCTRCLQHLPKKDPHHQKPREVTVEPAHKAGWLKALLPPSGEADRHEPITPTRKHPGRSMVLSLHGFCSIALQHLRHASMLFFTLSCILLFKLSSILPSIGYVDHTTIKALAAGCDTGTVRGAHRLGSGCCSTASCEISGLCRCRAN